MNSNRGEFREQRFQLLPNPLGQYFTGRIFQTRNVIQIVMIKLLVKRLENRFYFRKVANPASRGVNITAQMDRDLERVTMQTAAFMPLRDVRQAVRRFEGKLFENFHSVYSS